MIYSGLCSITFRKLSPEDLIALVAKAGLDGIEWGGDVHLPPGDPDKARAIRGMAEAAGLRACSYGSYFRCDREDGDFGAICGTAAALGAPVIRVWAGRKGSAETNAAYRTEVVSTLREAVDRATEFGITIALEYHGGTLTDTCESAHRLLKEVDRRALKLYWQPRTGGSFEEDRKELDAALPHLSHLHVFHWTSSHDEGVVRHPLSEGEAAWRDHFAKVAKLEEDRYAILEFVRKDDPEAFLDDAATLKRFLAESNPS